MSRQIDTAGNEQRHRLRHVATGGDGVEEWQCPECERKMLIRWRPRLERTVLVRGNELVPHSASRGLEISALGVGGTVTERWDAWLASDEFDRWRNTRPGD